MVATILEAHNLGSIDNGGSVCPRKSVYHYGRAHDPTVVDHKLEPEYKQWLLPLFVLPF